MDSNSEEPIIGVLGGMGPAATSRFFTLLVNKTPAKCDQGHVRTIIDSNPKIPDRTDYIIDDGPSPLPKLLDTVENIENAGANVLTIPCNTSHAFIHEISKSTNMQVLNMIKLTFERIKNHKDIENIALLATSGTLESEVYQNTMQSMDLDSRYELTTLSDHTQKKLMSLIYCEQGIKAGYINKPRNELLDILKGLNDVDAVIAGCTELSIVLSSNETDKVLFDPMDILAEVAIKKAKHM